MTGTSPDATLSPPQAAGSAEPHAPAAPPVLVCLPSASSESIAALLSGLPAAFPAGNVVLAGADSFDGEASGVASVPYTTPRPNLGWVLAGGDYTAAAAIAADRNCAGAILIGSEFFAGSPALLHGFASALASGADLVLPTFSAGAHDALVTSALLYPMSRALFGQDIRFPLPVAAAVSPRMLTRLATLANRVGHEGLLWPVSEAAAAGFSVRQVEAGVRTPPPPGDDDLNKLLTGVASSLFLDVEARAAFWQRNRPIAAASVPVPPMPSPAGGSEAASEVAEIVENFRLAYSNLLEIWSLVLPPQTLVALKRLSVASPSNFALPPELWARIVYEFALAFHLRSLNRGHLLGALTPLYLAWVASQVRTVGDDPRLAAQLVTVTAAAFEREKPYLVARWRWPDRFNP